MKVYRDKRIIILYLFPAIALMALFVYYPLVQSIVFSLFKWASFSPEKQWVGFYNYHLIVSDTATFFTILRNNFFYAVVSTIFQAGLGLVFAACLEEKFMRGTQPFFRTVLFIPSLIAMTVIAMLWQFMYDPNIGMINQAIQALGFKDFNAQWLGDSNLSIWCCIIVSQWQYIGYCMMLDLVGIQKIDGELFEAATIDGATRPQVFRYITLPLMKESILVTTDVTILGSVKVFTEVYVMTAGGPGRSSEVLATAMYRAAFKNDEMGVACAYAIMIFVLTFICAALQLKLSHTGEE